VFPSARTTTDTSVTFPPPRVPGIRSHYRRCWTDREKGRRIYHETAAGRPLFLFSPFIRPDKGKRKRAFPLFLPLLSLFRA